jgi:DNA invertase Pin-like site-specific DNA recombinase
VGHDQQEQTTASGQEPQCAVVYVRISDDPEGNERGGARQEADRRAYATAHGWEVAAAFKENDTSAFKQRTITLPSGERVRRVVRPEFRAMLKSLADHDAQVMIASDLDRAVRDPGDLEDLIDAKVLGGFSVRSVTGSLRLDTDSDIAMARVLVATANKSSADTARRVARAAKQQAIEGTWHGGRVPFGYRAEDGTRAKTSQFTTKAVWTPILDEDTWQQVGDVPERVSQVFSWLWVRLVSWCVLSRFQMSSGPWWPRCCPLRRAGEAGLGPSTVVCWRVCAGGIGLVRRGVTFPKSSVHGRRCGNDTSCGRPTGRIR